ncbi:MAG: glycoside hydrolase family 16 protein, partial [Pseudomonadota bacterium]|nr:glycoside hydrolase family 16 protein [Pseudomonadota bacterium]
MLMRALFLAATLMASSAAAAQAPREGAGWSLVWSDEFDGASLDAAKWNLADNCWGGGNEERQCYTPAPANHRVADGLLSIIARRETHSGPAFPPDQRTTPEKRQATNTKPFTSARL